MPIATSIHRRPSHNQFEFRRGDLGRAGAMETTDADENEGISLTLYEFKHGAGLRAEAQASISSGEVRCIGRDKQTKMEQYDEAALDIAVRERVLERARAFFFHKRASARV